MTENNMRRQVWRAGLGIAVIGAVSLGVIGIAAATGDDSDARAGAQPTEPAPAPEEDSDNDGDHWGGPWRGGWGGGGPWGGFDGILGENADIEDFLHTEVVLAKEGGGTQTVVVQKGAVTEVSGTAVSVKSTDGYTKSYAVNGDTRIKGDTEDMSSVAKDEEVLVVAPQSGDNSTATVLIDLTDIGWK